jgi:tetratricopeptide (TPR) repeat protein
MESVMKRARAIAAAIFVVTASLVYQTALAQRGSAIDTLAAQMTEAGQTGRQAEALALAQKLEGLVRRQQGRDNMNYAGVLHNEGMFLQNLGRYQEAVEKLNLALSIKLRNNDPASTLRTSNILTASLAMLDRAPRRRWSPNGRSRLERRRSVRMTCGSPERLRRWAAWPATRRTTKTPNAILNAHLRACKISECRFFRGGGLDG